MAQASDAIAARTSSAIGSCVLPSGRLPLAVLTFAVLYFLGAKLGIATSLPPQGVVTIWPPNAIVLVALLAVERRHWWAFGLATLITEIVADYPDYPLWAAAGYGVVNFAEAAAAAALMRRFGSGDPPPSGVEGFVRFLVIGPLLVSAAAALFGAAIYKINAPTIDYVHYWRVFWFGDALGLLIVGTSLLTFRRRPSWLRRAPRALIIEAVLLAAGLVGAGVWAFFTQGDVPSVYLLSPFLLWAALRFGMHGACAAVLVAVGLTIASAAARTGPFADLSNIELVVTLQGLSAVIALSTFFVGVTIEDFWRADGRLRAEAGKHQDTAEKLKLANRDLAKSNEHLDEIVAERTKVLERTIERNEDLLGEVHHRVKNSLQMVSSVVALQGKAGTAAELSQKITSQISAIASTYDVMHKMERVESADLSLLVIQLCKNISASTDGTVALTCETSGEHVVPADVAVASALAINELITNSIKHASGQLGRAEVNVVCREDGDEVVVRISDNGPGFDPGFDPRKAKGFGLRMSKSVVSRAGGELRISPCEQGSLVEIRLPSVGLGPERDL